VTAQPLAYLLAMLGSALGGGARLYVSTLVSRGLGTQFPWGTLTVNLFGCLAVGVLGAMFAPPGRIHDLQDLRVFLVVGVLGGFTTFSAFSLEALMLAQRGAIAAAAGYVAASLVGCLLAAWLGFSLAGAALR
jgi:CrcB protein